MADKEALAQFHRQSIQDAAERLFTDKGVAATSVDEIAAAAGYSKATLYVYFTGKHDIWNSVLLSAMTMLQERLTSAVTAHTGAIDRYYGACDALTEFAEQYPLYFDSLLDTITDDGHATSHRTSVVGDEITTLIARLVTDGIAEGVVADDADPFSTAVIMWASLSGIIRMVQRKHDYFTATTGHTTAELLRHGFEVVLRGISKQSA